MIGRILVFCGLCSASVYGGAQASTVWSPVARLPGGLVACLVLSPGQSGLVFAGGSAGLVFRSVDGGKTWKSTTVGGAGEVISTIATGSGNPSVVFAASGNHGYTNGQVYKSTDAGVTWSKLANQPPAADLPGQSIATDADGQVVVVANEPNGTYRQISRSADGGASWASVSFSVSGFTVNPNDGSLWAAGSVNGNGYGVYRSNDFGLTWTQTAFPPLPSGLSYGTIVGLAFQPGTATAVASWSAEQQVQPAGYQPTGGAYVTTDNGATWSATALPSGTTPPLNLSSGYGPLLAAAFDQATPTRAYLAVNGGAPLVSQDSGATWARVAGSFQPIGEAGIVTRPRGATFGAAVLTISPGIMSSSDGGAKWAHSDKGLNDGVPIDVRDAGAAKAYYAASRDGLFSSNDNAATWSRISTWPGIESIDAMAVDLKSASHALYVTTASGYFRSQNSGATWVSITPPPVGGNAAGGVSTNPLHAGEVYAGGSAVLYRSTDYGATWQVISSSTLSITASNKVSGRLYGLQNYSQVVVSNDDGQTWAPTAGQPPAQTTLLSLTVSGSQPESIIITGNGSKLPTVAYRSVDGGATFQSVSALSSNTYIPWSLSAAPNSAKLLASSQNDNLLSFSRDAGETWLSEDNALSDYHVGTVGDYFADEVRAWAAISDGTLYTSRYSAFK